MSIDLSGKAALVTGDCRGIGAAVVGGEGARLS
jgi:NAD(P)-dependent dehydrogenase (short-subunit alcohol dehydrogenase family)